MSKLAQYSAACILALVCSATPRPTAQSSRPALGAVDDWPYYGHDAGGMRYSPLAQIDRKNVTTLNHRLPDSTWRRLGILCT